MSCLCHLFACSLPHHITSLHVQGSRIYAADSQESVHYMKVGSMLGRHETLTLACPLSVHYMEVGGWELSMKSRQAQEGLWCLVLCPLNLVGPNLVFLC